MLTVEDKKYIQETVNETVTNAQTDLIEKILIPYFDELHKEIKKTHSKIELIDEHLKDHEKRITKLEVKTGF